MCGIFGYVGKKDSREIIIDGLKRLEYRGYDSWGVAVTKDEDISIFKKVGPIGTIDDVQNHPKTNIGIGHTRWATHGGVSETNSHPHISSDKSFVLAQNGIVENFQEIKTELAIMGHKFISQTDTEIIVRLIEENLKKNSENLLDTTRKSFLQLKGRNTIILLENKGNHILAVRNGSPLVVGVGKDEYYFASDTLSFADKTDQVVFIDNNEMVEYLDGKLKLIDVFTGKEKKINIVKLDQGNIEINKEGFDHYMLKEIVEQKHTIREAIQYSAEELQPLVDSIKKANRVYTVGAGTAGFAAGQIAFFLRKYAKINAVELKSYEIGSYIDLFTDKDLLIAVSQSGETADTIEAVDLAKKKGTKIASIVNMIGSTITRLSDFQFLSRSGPEICVASTKAFTAQIAWGLVLAMTVVDNNKEAKDSILELSEKLNSYFTKDLFSTIGSLVEKICKNEHFFVLGKDQNNYISQEAALKVKEISYKHFEGFTSGELKHGVIALIEKDTPVFVIISNDEYKDDILSATAQVKARGAMVIGVAKENNDLFDEFIKTIDSRIADPIANIIPFQLISYFMALQLGLSPDKPRNLAKSVTVK